MGKSTKTRIITRRKSGITTWIDSDILDRIYAYAFDYHEKGNITDAEIYYKFLCIYAFENHEYLKVLHQYASQKRNINKHMTFTN